jgi:hypothetical protein
MVKYLWVLFMGDAAIVGLDVYFDNMSFLKGMWEKTDYVNSMFPM